MLNIETGRKLEAPAGGNWSSTDVYDTQIWKNAPGITYVLHCCIENINHADYEGVWPLLIPPLMTILDDREPRWRLRALDPIAMFVEKAPTELLRRTGVHNLLESVRIMTPSKV